jgi:hypothetical protein
LRMIEFTLFQLTWTVGDWTWRWSFLVPRYSFKGQVEIYSLTESSKALTNHHDSPKIWPSSCPWSVVLPLQNFRNELSELTQTLLSIWTIQ